MPKAMSKEINSIIENYGLNPEEALWDCHGTWCMKHHFIEQVATKANITTQLMQVVKAEDNNVAIVVKGECDERIEWAFGEASPKNNKNAYPFAMAEKRAKDRVILKLIGLAGHVYSESDIADPSSEAPFEIDQWDTWADETIQDIRTFTDLKQLDDWTDKNRMKFGQCVDHNRKAAQRVKAAKDEKGSELHNVSIAAE